MYETTFVHNKSCRFVIIGRMSFECYETSTERIAISMAIRKSEKYNLIHSVNK